MNNDSDFKIAALNAFLNGQKMLAGKPLYFSYTKDLRSYSNTPYAIVKHTMIIGREEEKLSLTLPVYTNLSNSEYYIAIDLNSIPEFAIHVFIPSMIRVVMRRLGDTELCAWINRLRVVNKMLFNEYLPRQIIDVYNRHGLMGIQACNVIEERESPCPY